MKKYLDRSSSRIAGNRQGFTILEVMLAMVIFGFGILMVSKMAGIGFISFDRARTETDEVNRTVKSIDTLEQALYANDQVFSANPQGGQDNYPLSPLDQPIISSWDFNDVVMRGTKLIAVENNQIRGPSINLNVPGNSVYRLYIVKADRQRVQ